MYSEKKHIIEKVFLEVDTTSETLAVQIKNNAGFYVEEKLFPLLEKLFDEYDSGENILRFERMDISFSLEDWEDEKALKLKLTENINAKLSRVEISGLNNAGTSRSLGENKNLKQIVRTQQNAKTTFLFFIKNGYLPWYGKQEYIDEITTLKKESGKLTDEAFLSDLKNVLQNSDTAVERLVLQFPDETIFEFIEAFNVLNISDLFFIKNGYLPWYGKQEYIDELSTLKKGSGKITDEAFLSDLKNVLQNSDTAVERLVLQFPDKTVLEFIEAFNVLNISDNEQFLHFVNSGGIEFRKRVFTSLIMFSVNTLEGKKYFREILTTYIKTHKAKDKKLAIIEEQAKNLVDEIRGYFGEESITDFLPENENEIRDFLNELDEIEKGSAETASSNINIRPTNSENEFVFDKNESPFFEEGNNEILVQNAGLVILGPFLPTFLKQFNWVSESGSIKRNEALKVVQAIHFLASGKTLFFEANMVFEKFLCGLPLTTPIPRKSLLNNEVLDEAENLLSQVIKNWPALKNTGIDGLRQMFLSRNGKLIKTEQGFKLLIERKAQDILLDKLQWNISLLKLPWKEELLFVEW